MRKLNDRKTQRIVTRLINEISLLEVDLQALINEPLPEGSTFADEVTRHQAINVVSSEISQKRERIKTLEDLLAIFNEPDLPGDEI